ncbi:putative agglutination protein [Streptomyces himastatinicus ATCC 53653]|uniref:Putative agglutination protein n=2 Tax=Streptomyces violaceusniger group TaxID=2839105 RepID=D9WJ49_9ACTN|nr:putative agglutination protein [Streptomyces himastatinicus ATCC 53653]
MNMPPTIWAKEIVENRFASGSVFTLLDEDDSTPADWDTFADSWSRLPVDAFMAHGETYRRRRHSVFNVYADGLIDELEPRPYLQSPDINHLNGGVLRTYEPIETAITSGSLFRGLLAGLTAVLTEVHGFDVWHHQCFQNRITTSSEQTGNPTPEGMHRDGVDYVVTLLVRRCGIEGGRSGLYDAVTRRQVHSETLTAPGDTLIADDGETLHDATPITPAAPDRPGYRDVFIDVITRGSQPR